MAGRKNDGGEMVLGGRHLVGIFALLVVILGVVFTLGYLLGRSQYDGRLGPAVEAARRPDKLIPAIREEKTEKADKPGKSGMANQSAAANNTAQHPPDFDFYHSGEENQQPARLEPPPKPVVSKPKPEPNPLVARATAPPAVAAPQPTPSRAAIAAAQPAVAAKNSKSPRPAAPLNTPPIPSGATVLQVAALVREADALALAQALQQKKFPAFVLTPGADNFYRVQVGPYADAQSVAAARHGLEAQGFKAIIKR